MSELTYEDFKQRLTIQDLLLDAGYHMNRRDGLRYPSYVRLDSDGRRIRGDKFIVTGNNTCCFQPPTYKNYNIISFIKEHPDLFSDYRPGMSPDRLVNLVCNRLLNHPIDNREVMIFDPIKNPKPFRLDNYELFHFDPDKWETQKKFYPFFVHRGIDLRTQAAFKDHFMLATKKNEEKLSYTNLSFPLNVPGRDEIVGFEERGRMRKLAETYKGKAEGSNSSQGLWIANLSDVPLASADRVLWFESAYDAMAYHQLHRKEGKDQEAVYVSTGGHPTQKQFLGMLEAAPKATHYLCFDNDQAGKKFAINFAYSPTLEWKDYVNSMTDPLKRGSGEADLLPDAARHLYGKAEKAEIEFYTLKASGMICKEELQEVKQEALDAWDEYSQELQKALPFRKNIVIATAPEGHKDWNDALLAHLKHTHENVNDESMTEERRTSAFRR